MLRLGLREGIVIQIAVEVVVPGSGRLFREMIKKINFFQQ